MSLCLWEREIIILWSTQGGRAKACARRTCRILRDYYFDSKDSANDDNDKAEAEEEAAMSSNYYGMSFDDFGAEEFLNLGNYNNSNSSNSNKGHANNTTNNNIDGESKKKLVIMFVSTTGDGEHCDTIQDTWKLL